MLFFQRRYHAKANIRLRQIYLDLSNKPEANQSIYLLFGMIFLL